jgi:hypothetical protein
MPDNPTQAPGQNGSYINMSRAPGADLSFDDLFPVEPENVSAAPQAPQGTTPPAPAAPSAPYLKSEDGRIVYNTSEDAIKGIAHKDALVERYRTYLSSQGIDPNTLQSSRPEPQAPAPTTTTNSQYTYLDHEDKLFDELSAAATKGDKKAYGQLLRTYNREILNQEFAPIAPLIAEVARQRAVRQVSSEAPEFSTFQSSDRYRDTLDKLPKLKQAIELAENDLNMADSLGELYRITYLVSQGMNKPEVVVPAAAPAAPVQNPPRPTTMQPTSMAPPQPGVAPDLRTSEGRKSLIRDMEARGIGDLRF